MFTQKTVLSHKIRYRGLQETQTSIFSEHKMTKGIITFYMLLTTE